MAGGPARATLVLGSGKAGHEANALGVAEALGLPYRIERSDPSRLYASLAPYGPADPTELKRLGAIHADVLIVSGRGTIPLARALKRLRGARLFAVCLQDPRGARRAFDLIWTPEHDTLRGANVITTLTSPHPISPMRLAAARAAPDPRLASLPSPRCGIVLGGPSAVVAYDAADCARLGAAVAAILAQGHSVMATPSRRTTPMMMEAVRAACQGHPAFVWDGTGENPYAAILALSDALLVTADSANMVGEAAATGAPVHLFRAEAQRAGKLDTMIAGLKGQGAVRDFAGALERFTYAPIDATGQIAREIERRMALRGL